MSSLQRCVLAVDSGGTKCDALLTRDDGVVLGWGRCNWNGSERGRSKFGGGRSRATVTRAINIAFGDYTCDELHIAGISCRVGSLLPLYQHRAGIAKIYHLHECDPAFVLCRQETGIVVIAGTGAVVYGVTRDGRTRYLDGLGPQLGDYGSAYQIGALAVRAAARATWGPRHATSLSDAIFSMLHMGKQRAGLGALVHFMVNERDRAEIASFARVVDAEARAGDRIAIGILHTAAEAMAETVRDILDRLDMHDTDYPLIGMGSVAVHSTIFWEHLTACVYDFAPRLHPCLAHRPAVLGAVLVPLRRLAAADVPSLESNLFTTAELLHQ